MTRHRSAAERFFGLLLTLLPLDFRDDFEDEMRVVFRADHSESIGAGRWNGMVGFWWRIVFGILRTAPRAHLDSLMMDLRYTARTIRKRPIFLTTAVLSLAVGIGATTSVIAVLDATFIRTIPGVTEPERLVNIKPWSTIVETFELTSYPNYVDLRDGNSVLADLAGFNGTRLSWIVDGEPEVVPAQVVSGNYFDVLGVRPRLGRLFAVEEDRSPTPVAVISSWLWRERFGEETSVLGREILLNGSTFTVIGVAPEGFRGHFVGFNFDIFLPTSLVAVAGLPDRRDRGASWVELIGRLRPGVSVEQAQKDFGVQASRLLEAFPNENRGMEIRVERNTGIDADLRGGLLTFLIGLLAVSGFVLLIACVNVANMMLGRMVWRGREMALRLAVGAPRSRLARQLLTESAVISLLAGGLGTALAFWATGFARAALPALGGAVAIDARVEPRVLVAAFVISLLAALGFGLAPALHASRAALTSLMKEPPARAGGSWLRTTMVVAQVVLSLVILITAGLFLRALQRASTIDPGFDPVGVVAASLDPALVAMEEDASRVFFDDLLDRVANHPGVESAGYASRIPLSLGARFFPNPIILEIPGWEPPPGQLGFTIEHAVVSEGYLETLRIPIIEGRGVAGVDDRNGRPVAVVNERFAERFFGASPAVGQTLRQEDRVIEVVGVARDSRYRTLDEEPMPFVYLPFAQNFPGRAVVLARPSSAAGGLSETLRELIREQSRNLPLTGPSRFEDGLAVSLLPQRVAGSVAGVLGLLGIFLTAVGLYGVLAYSVSRRTSEIGLRMSLGAAPPDVLRLVLGQGLSMSAIGIAVGIPLAALAARFLDVFLYDLSPLDPLTYAVVTMVLVATAVSASYVPARRAANIDPIKALRAE